ncbi:hypothetical protein U9M48_029433 [Paspalum notatum var. saurae]|uniref:AP2/ERF domain-containing protein n=1 Tax=Paspalum notatum var. saurae TaxID=547442 RepID=A0AAQ3X2P5_PASNO
MGIWLGSYDTPEKAARAFDAASVCLRGPAAAGLNFPDSPPAVARTTSLAHEVYAAAVAHANRAPGGAGAAAAAPAPVAEEDQAATAAADPTPTTARGRAGALAPLPLPVPAAGGTDGRSFDWSQLVSDPIFSPVTGSHSYLLPVSPTAAAAAADMNAEEDGSGRALAAFGVWIDCALGSTSSLVSRH